MNQTRKCRTCGLPIHWECRSHIYSSDEATNAASDLVHGGKQMPCLCVTKPGFVRKYGTRGVT